MMKAIRKSLLVLLVCMATSQFLHSQNTPGPGEYTTSFVPHQYSSIWRGTKIDTLFPSGALGYGKNVSIFTPEKFGWHPDEKYALIVMFDRQDTRILDNLLQSVDLLESYGQIPRTVIVGIESGRGPDQRRREAKWGLDGGNAYGEKYDEFVFNELVPYINKNYKIDTNQIIIYGHSWFGYHSTMILIRHIPELFAVISASPCCLSGERIDDIVYAVTHCGPLDHKFFYRVASGHDIGDDLNVYRELTGKIALSRLPENFDYKPTWFDAAMHMEVPGLLFHQALYDIYSDWADLAYAYADPGNNPTFDDASLYDSLQAISDKIYGFRIPIYDRHLRMRAEYYRYIKDEKVSNLGKIATWKFMISKYGETPELYYNIAETYQVLNDPVNSKEYLNKVKAYNLDEGWQKKVKQLESRIGSVSR
jgi:hypothetical protein